MVSDDVARGFVSNHYYDLFDKSGRYDGIYICDTCEYKEVWQLQPTDERFCPIRDCDGNLHLKTGLRKDIERVLTADLSSHTDKEHQEKLRKLREREEKVWESQEPVGVI